MRPVVLFSVKAPDERTNPFITLLSRSVSSASEVVYFDWRRALVGRYDVFHVHWPENLFRASGALRPVKGLLAWILLLRLFVLRPRIVWTVHNEVPHERGGFIERIFLQAFAGLVTHHVAMSKAQARKLRITGQCRVIPHGHYRTWLSGFDVSSRINDRVLFWGIMRPYKGIESLVNVFKDLPMHSASLRLVGLPSLSNYQRSIENQVKDDERISAEFTYATDSILVHEISNCVINVLPYKRMGNSGVALFTLSLNRPILIPDSPYARELQDVVGADWVHIYLGELTVDVLQYSLSRASGMKDKVPDLGYFDWDAIGTSYSELYRMTSS